jgi:hypothetical protein
MENLLQGTGLIICVGALLLVVLVAVFARNAFSGSGNRTAGREDDRIWREQGDERPRYDSDEIRSSGGFGNAGSRPAQRRSQPSSSRGSGLLRRTGDRLADYRARRSGRRSSRNDDVSSRGGFGR